MLSLPMVAGANLGTSWEKRENCQALAAVGIPVAPNGPSPQASHCSTHTIRKTHMTSSQFLVKDSGLQGLL